MEDKVEWFKAYYALVQYCPDSGRQESCNVGLVLLREDPYFFHCRFDSNNDRVKRFFPDVSIFHLDCAKAAWYNALERENKEESFTPHRLQRIMKKRSGNSLVSTGLRSCIVREDAMLDFERMFAELVR